MHTKYSPSGSHRWLNCAAGLRPSANQDAGSNFHADLGTAAHGLLETCLRFDSDPMKFLGNKMHKDHAVDEDMVDAVSHGLDWLKAYLVKHKRAKYFIEYEVMLSEVLKVQQHEQGTADVIVDDEPNELVVLDYKHGAGVQVEVEANSQLMIYAVGYQAKKKVKYKRYRFVIVQPRARHKDGPVREWTCTHEELMAFKRKLVKRVSFIEANPTQATAGDWCKWCPHASTCKALTEHALKLARIDFDDIEHGTQTPVDPLVLSPREVGAILRHGPMIEAWLNALRADALASAMKGHKIPGHKLVLGKTSRYFSDETRVKDFLLGDGFKLSQFAPRKMVGVPGVEKLYRQRKRGTKLPTRLAKMILRTKPPIHLARESDEREEYVRGDEFKDD